jgi:hypothetical protein
MALEDNLSLSLPEEAFDLEGQCSRRRAPEMHYCDAERLFPGLPNSITKYPTSKCIILRYYRYLHSSDKGIIILACISDKGQHSKAWLPLNVYINATNAKAKAGQDWEYLWRHVTWWIWFKNLCYRCLLIPIQE